MNKFLILIVLAVIFTSCNKDNGVSPVNPANELYKILTIDTSRYKIEMYSETSSSLLVGYNEIGFKVFVDGTEMKTGFLKYTPLMVHVGGHGHSTPVESEFLYDNSKGLFKGYVCYSMLSDTTSFWFADYNFNNELLVRNKKFYVISGTGSQMRIWLNVSTNTLYYLTLISPKLPSVGLNDFSCILHKTIDQSFYSEVDSASMFIRPWMESHGHGSSNNVNPVWESNGKYSGKVNFTMPGQWFVYDSIIVNNQVISPESPLYLVFDVR